MNVQVHDTKDYIDTSEDYQCLAYSNRMDFPRLKRVGQLYSKHHQRVQYPPTILPSSLPIPMAVLAKPAGLMPASGFMLFITVVVVTCSSYLGKGV